MSVPWQNMVKEVRYWLFPEARLIDERTKQLDATRQELRTRKAQTDHIIKNANRPDVLRNLVSRMTEDQKNG